MNTALSIEPADSTALPDADLTRLRRLIVGYRVSQALFVAARLGIADLLADGSQSLQSLAESAGAHPPSLYRVLRLLASEGVFAEEADETFSMTSLAQGLKKDAQASLRSRATFEGEECNWRAWGNIMHSIYTGTPAFNDEFKMGFFEYVKENENAAGVFDELMAAQTLPWASAIAEAYDFSEVGTLVDVAGGYGALLTTLLKRQPELAGILFDLEHVIQQSRTRIEAMPDVAGRCNAVAGDFFQSIPEGGDCYLLKYILHDWDDEHAVKILRNCRKAMPKTGGRLLIVELIIAPGNNYDWGKSVDVDMLVLTGGMERTIEQHRHLLQQSGFELTRVVPTRCDISVIEALPV